MPEGVQGQGQENEIVQDVRAAHEKRHLVVDRAASADP